MIITLIEPRSVDIIKAFETFWFTTATSRIEGDVTVAGGRRVAVIIEACPTSRVVPDFKLEYFEANIEGD